MGSTKRNLPWLQEDDSTSIDSGKKQRVSFTNINTVLITVGPEKAKHYIHSHRLCEESGFFRAAINSRFKESSEHVIDLPEENVDNVDNFIGWLYREQLPKLNLETLSDPNCTTSDPKFTTSDDEVDRLCYQFIFADKYDIPRLKKDVLLDLVELAMNCKAPGPDMIAHYYKAVGQNSPLRRLLCDWYTLRVHQDQFGDEDHQKRFIQNPEWAADLLAACARNWAVSWKAQASMTANDYL